MKEMFRGHQRSSLVSCRGGVVSGACRHVKMQAYTIIRILKRQRARAVPCMGSCR